MLRIPMLWKALALIAIILFMSACGLESPPATPGPAPEATPGPLPDIKPTPEPTPGPTATPSPTPLPPPYKGDPAFIPYVVSFIIDSLIYGFTFDLSKLTIQFSELTDYPSTTIGLCTTGCKGCPIVSIKGSYWNTKGDVTRQMLINHELGHCLLLRGHNSVVDGDGNPVSLMYPRMFSSSLYTASREEYVEELFENAMDEDETLIYTCE